MTIFFGGRPVRGFGLEDSGPTPIPLCGFPNTPDCDRFTLKTGHRYVAGGIFLYRYKPDFPMAEEEKQDFISSFGGAMMVDWVKALGPPNDLGAAAPQGFQWALSVIFQGYAKRDQILINGQTETWLVAAQVPDNVTPPPEPPAPTPPSVTEHRGVKIIYQLVPGGGCVAAFVTQQGSFDVQDVDCDGAIAKAKAKLDSMMGGGASPSSSSHTGIIVGIAAGVVLAGAALIATSR